MSYQGRILHIDLGSGAARVEELDGKWARQYLGGKGLGARYFTAGVPARTDPLSPANRVVLMTGPLGGTIAPCTGRLSITTKSPATGTILESGIGGTIGPEIKFAG
ncbi:MAG TPA: aldehyde ferredoxin oxidoreductase, partial [Clostridiales bacterium]|nr:aldehyde ferredoxin oxidoreductase [Clostridiales bacterium]